jgi:hypothetical protein
MQMRQLQGGLYFQGDALKVLLKWFEDKVFGEKIWAIMM